MDQDNLSRALAVLADGEPVAGFHRANLSGRDALGLLPHCFLLRLWNLEESDYLLLSRAKRVAVRHGNSVLASGTVTDAARRMTPEGLVTQVVFSPAIGLWEAPVSLSVEAGVSVSETVRRILAASGTGIRLLTWSGPDPVRSRGQAFFGRAAECVSAALSAASALGYLTEGGLGIVPASGLPVTMTLTEKDLIDEPSFAAGNLMILRTTVTGWPLGKRAAVEWKGKRVEGIVLERSVDADSVRGGWEGGLIVQMHNE